MIYVIRIAKLEKYSLLFFVVSKCHPMGVVEKMKNEWRIYGSIIFSLTLTSVSARDIMSCSQKHTSKAAPKNYVPHDYN